MEIEKIYGNLPTLETERLTLRKMNSKDITDIFEYASNEEVTKYVTWNTHRTFEDTKQFVKLVLNQYKAKRVAPWVIEDKENRKVIGTIDFVSWNPEQKVAEIGYAISQDYWGKGITTEATKKIIKFGFEKMDLVRIQARCFSENIGSARVMEKAGMSFEGVMRNGVFLKGKHRDLKIYSILKEEFFPLEKV